MNPAQLYKFGLPLLEGVDPVLHFRQTAVFVSGSARWILLLIHTAKTIRNLFWMDITSLIQNIQTASNVKTKLLYIQS